MPFLWNAEKRRYEQEGREVSARQLREWVTGAVESSKARIERFTLEAKAGRINSAEWALRMKREIQNMHRAASMIANGGRDQMKSRDWSRVGGVVSNQNSYFQKFFADVTRDKNNLDPARAKLYAESMYLTYENMVRAREMKAGMRYEERRSVSDGESCSECPTLAGRREPIGTLPAIGSTSCISNCRCYFEYFEDAA